ncbi:MAG: helix-turn-helix domain-containing protein [Roseiflexus sp.]|nr:helix-turn-helix domain-containing protein [Roseiflexus sp.]MBO9340615.1 helix-turn-helix domain-containing protein [Roseiflexus sp.]MBO9365621.1 helix-turn-helix domain-containing protein [Roseiflexus sp.]MBO9381825.1 helix-turn-helix domain-containing protein [Roseiflexus sp.]MBO9390495.1 helix-turn-helix domain-containing protein [Roseiflexus sp.]
MPNPEQVDYFKHACDTARFVWNWALAEWRRRRAAGEKPSAMALKNLTPSNMTRSPGSRTFAAMSMHGHSIISPRHGTDSSPIAKPADRRVSRNSRRKGAVETASTLRTTSFGSTAQP